jgi:hypothetical protein
LRGGGGGQDLGAEAVHDLHAVVDIVAFVQLQAARELFDVHDIRQLRLGKTQDGERTARNGVPPRPNGTTWIMGIR